MLITTVMDYKQSTALLDYSVFILVAIISQVSEARFVLCCA